jgi:glycosyltransferase involved in cell wall biosynthesis
MKRVLYLAYYWPPCGGIGPVRNLKFTKYFREFGWEPVIYAPLNAGYPIYDESTLRDLPPNVEILRTPIREPYALFNLAKGKKKDAAVKDVFLVEEQKSGLMHSLALWVRGNLFIPDARALWIKPSIQFLREYLKKYPVDAMISYGPPHSMHRIALALHKEFGIPWVSDWQDPWTQIDYYEKFPMLPVAKRIHERMELEVLHTANEVVMVSKSWCVDLEHLSGRKVHYIPFGYDADDFKTVTHQHTDKFIISHFGSFGTDRNPEALWSALHELCLTHPHFAQDLQIHLAGHVDSTVFKAMEMAGLTAYLKYDAFISKDSLFQQMVNSAVQLVLINKPEEGLRYNNKGRIPAKVFECLGAQKPILVIGPPDGDVAQIVRETNQGINAGYDEQDAMRNYILDLYTKWKAHTPHTTNESIEAYSFKNLCAQMSHLLDAIAVR